MGMNWRIKMVLLSTLAALVIIVHSAEEDYEQYNRRELRPRIYDTGTSRSYDQAWRTLELEPVTQQTTPRDTWISNSSGEPPRRRKLGRKRKRRPELSSSEESVPLEKYGLTEEFVRPYYDVDSERKAVDTPKRRRKKQEPRPGRWDSQLEEDRPVRRRGLRRKRPTSEPWPEAFSEFNIHRPDDIREINDKAEPDTRHIVGDDFRYFNNQDNNQSFFTDIEHYRQPLAEGLGIQMNTAQDNENHTRLVTDIREESRLIKDTSFSEFSQEDSRPIAVKKSKDDDNTDVKDKTITKSQEYLKDAEKVREKMISPMKHIKRKKVSKVDPHHDIDMGEHYYDLVAKFEEKGKLRKKNILTNTGPIDPHTLKEILKKSNGTSLSEILQQHNLTLADLLHGKEEVLSVLKSDNSEVPTDSNDSSLISESSSETTESNIDKSLENSGTKHAISETESALTTDAIQNVETDFTTEPNEEQPTSEKPKTEDTSRRPNMRKYPTAMRRKQRIRPMVNTTYKSQLSRDMIALNARKYFNNRRRNGQEWKDLAPIMKKNISSGDNNKNIETETTTLHSLIEEITIQELDNCTKNIELENEKSNASENLDDIEVITERQKSVKTKTDIVHMSDNVTEKPKAESATTPTVSASGLRRQAFNNRLKKKRLKQKNLTTEPPQDDIMMNLFGIPNLVSSSEFIARTQGPKTSLDDVTILEDFITTEIPRRHESKTRTTKYILPRTSTTPHTVFKPISTEETAKIEIEEIFNDTQTSERLSKILKERNMTLDELVELRERGSSHVHLADIFHNASKEPNPPEPFLSKSLIEPISKETYPLRALLDANNHDTTAKSLTSDPVTMQTEINIPIVMNFGNNVNENAENMGIMSLFHNITTKNETDATSKTALRKDSQGKLYETSITVVNTTDGNNDINNTIRESRVIHVLNDNQDDIVSWNEIFSLMRRNYENQTESTTKAPTIGLLPAENIKKPTLEEDLDGDGVIVLEDLQHLKDFDSNIASESNENLDFNKYERAENPTTRAPTILDKIPSQTKSVTVATASITGLAMVLFLLTYIGYRWQQQKRMTRKKSFSDERVPSPVFENRKGHKNNSSTRSISPMLSSNIYTLNTLDSRNGKESPDYMWDSLRKPFQ